MPAIHITPIRRLLVANRGEIARRIFRTAQELGKFTIAVHADGDAREPFVQEADMAIPLGGITSTETYLHIQKVLAAAEHAGADAVHPGYGFLSENPDFASAVVDAGLIWIGPPAPAIRTMGDKLAAKALMEEAGVPTLPSREIGDGRESRALAREIGYPLLVKAAAGGGGKGMRVVEDEAGLEAAIEAARREAASAFGDDRLFLERWLASSRHVEIQIMGDLHGNIVHYFERECSIQRRHQKIIEEAPSTAVGPQLRSAMGATAVTAARKLNYSSAGTVEFLLEGENFWFLEVNTRLQVEHPVTEEITGRDLVAEQIRIAEGERHEGDQSEIEYSGHAIEARICAEDPTRGFLPSPGKVEIWEPYDLDGAVRFDSGIETGSEVSMEFDPMIAKVIAFDDTRRGAAEKLVQALEATRIAGIATNRDFLVNALGTENFLSGDTTTDFIDRVQPATRRTVADRDWMEAAIAICLHIHQTERQRALLLGNLSPFWSVTPMPARRTEFQAGDRRLEVGYRTQRDGSYSLEVGGRTWEVEADADEFGALWLTIGSKRMQFDVERLGDRWFARGPEGELELREVPRVKDRVVDAASGGLTAPMPGKILALEVSEGRRVVPGQVLVIMEAMKMEHRITSPGDGIVRAVTVKPDDQVEKDCVLVELDLDDVQPNA